MKGLLTLTEPQCVQRIMREIELLSKGQASVQALMYAIVRRENLMNQLKKIDASCKEVLGVLLDNVRKATLIVIEAIARFRAELKALSQENVLVVFKNQNYFEKIAIDTKEIIDIRFPQAFKFARRFDVFFLSISQPTPLLPNNSFKSASKRRLTLSMPVGELYTRVKKAEAYFLAELASLGIHSTSDIKLQPLVAIRPNM
eukprot:TRINITY_DN11213_c0_g1_i3.p1 TRINITY_DN11213_c0_g1~~TRINITY_DN11213_c0_g1_i3.p1  ORF type:complete len:201 (+),score=38.22 TRINITY_DN11213_c0_g1_i3:433-1035(+)